MGILTIQFGQCGNQIGHALFKYIIKDITNTKDESVTKLENSDYATLATDFWFSDCKNDRYVPRSILVDTENKVVSSLLNNKDSIKFKNVVAKNCGGSANNWAFGYSQKSEYLVDDVINIVRKEIEKSDDVTYVMNLLSSGGGTGSGSGSRVLESLREEFPNKTILNVIVLPYKTGEVVTQSYNTLLTLAKLYDITDGNIILENDLLQKVCSTSLSIKNVNLFDMNFVIAKNVTSLFQPAYNYSVHDFVSHLTSHPNYKFIQIKSTPIIARQHLKYETVPTWQSLVEHMRKEFRVINPLSLGTNTPRTVNSRRFVINYWKSVASLLISRGGEKPDKSILEPLSNNDLYPSWVSTKIKHFHQPRQLYETDRFLTLATNNNSIINTLDSIINHAWNLFQHKAYLHQYLKYGMGETDFETAFEKLEYVLTNYKEL